MSNLLKRGMTVSKSERVIDYNELIRNKLASIMENQKQEVDPDGFVTGLNADVVEQLVSDDNDDMQEEVSATSEQSLEAFNVQAQEIISSAQAEADRIKEEASNQAEQIAQEARNQGYKEGVQQSQQEYEQMKNELAVEYEQKIKALEDEYEQKKALVEPELVDVITEVFRKVTMTVAEDNQEIILHLINGVMKNTDNSKEYIIKASSEDYKFLVANQGKIYCAMSKEVQIDIVEDASMKQNECVIETDTGIFNCSLDIELKNLIKNIKLLSCV